MGRKVVGKRPSPRIGEHAAGLLLQHGPFAGTTKLDLRHVAVRISLRQEAHIAADNRLFQIARVPTARRRLAQLAQFDDVGTEVGDARRLEFSADQPRFVSAPRSEADAVDAARCSQIEPDPVTIGAGPVERRAQVAVESLVAIISLDALRARCADHLAEKFC